MNILIAPDKFKGSLAAKEVGEALKKGIHQKNANLRINVHPMADGGDGSISILSAHMDIHSQYVNTKDPLARNIKAQYYVNKNTAFIELASASGLVLLEEYERNPLATSTRGTGIMIKDAIKKGYQKIWLFLGGSATNDGGIGIAQSLGYDFLDDNGDQLDPVGANLDKIKSIKDHRPSEHREIEFTLLCDVTNPMYGPQGAAHVFAAQKGAEMWAVKKLDNGLKNFDTILRSQFHMDIADIPGIGAAGAIGASMLGLFGAEIRSGFEMMSDVTGLENAIRDADLVISGEGKIDSQSLDGKVVSGVAELCRKYRKPLIIVAGESTLSDSNKEELGATDIQTIIDRAKNLRDAMKNGKEYLIEIGKGIEFS